MWVYVILYNIKYSWIIKINFISIIIDYKIYIDYTFFTFLDKYYKSLKF